MVNVKLIIIAVKNILLLNSDNDDCSLHCEDVTDPLKKLRTFVVSGTPCRTAYGEEGSCLGNQCAVRICQIFRIFLWLKQSSNE